MLNEREGNKDYFIRERDNFIECIAKEIGGLTQYSVDHFGYREFTPKGHSFGFSTKNQWYNLKKTKEFCQEMRNHFEAEITKVYLDKLKFVSRSKDAEKNQYLRLLDQNDMGNSLVMYRFKPNKIESFFFNSESLSAYSRDVMINNLALFENITHVLSRKIHHAMSVNAKYVLENTLFLKFSNADVLFNYPKALHNTAFSRLELSIKNTSVSLTLRDLQFLSTLKISNSNKEVSQKLGVSVRTVEGFITRIRSKCKINSKSELIMLLQRPELEVIFHR